MQKTTASWALGLVLACAWTLPAQSQSPAASGVASPPPAPAAPPPMVLPPPPPVAVPGPPQVIHPVPVAIPAPAPPSMDWMRLDERVQQQLPGRQAFLPALRTLGPDEGILRFALVTNDLRARRPDIVVLVDERTQFEVRPVSDGLAQNLGLYIAVLPAGRYTLRRLDDRGTFRWIAFGGLAQRALGQFEVKPGAVADLGTILLTPVTTESYQLARLDYRVPEEEWRTAAPASLAIWAALPAGGGWRGAQWGTAQAAAIRAPVGIQQVRELADGTLLLPTALGRLRVRAPTGEWRELVGPRPTPFVWATPGVSPGEYLALGESQSAIRFWPDGRAEEIVFRGLPAGRLIHASHGSDGQWYLAQEQRLAVKLLRAPSLDATAWEEVGSVKLTESVWSGNRGAFITDTADGLLLVQSSTGLLRHYSYATGQFTDRHLEGKRDILAVDVMPDGTISVLTIAAGGFAGVFSGAWISTDRGATWQEVNTGYKVKVTPLVLPGDGRLLQAGGVFGDSGIKVSTDGGKTWTQLTEELPVESRVIATRTLGLLAVRRIGVQDVLLRSADGGRSWVYEWSSLERAGVERMLKREAEERAARDAKRAAAGKQR